MEYPDPTVQHLDHPLWSQLQALPDPASCAFHLRQVLPLRHLTALTPPTEWWHQDGAIPSAQLPIAASAGSPAQLECHDHPFHWLVLVHAGHVTVTQNNRSHSMEAGDGVLLPGHAWSLHSQLSSTTTIGLDPLELLGAARSLAPAHWGAPTRVDSPLQSLFPLPTHDDDIGAAVVETISLLLPALHRITRLGDTLNDAFLPREQLHRLIAVLLFPELRRSQDPGEEDGTSSDRRLDRLLDYISLHLSDPLPLRVLETVSHYSRRSLHYAFKERFGCSPMQWIRQQRMERALRFLQNAGPTDTVSSVALACGYRSQGRFRIDFERTYGWKPSTVLREGGLPKGSGGTNGLSSSNTTSSVAP